MKRLPILPTLLVAIMVPTMIALGFWQLRRAEWKEGLLARLAANAEAPLIDAPAKLTADKESLSFRKVRVTCAGVSAREPTAARSIDGAAGYRQLILCKPAAGEALLVSLGVAADPTQRVGVAPGAAFTGRLVPRSGDPTFLLVAESPVGALVAEAPPGPDTISNSHRGYAVQWFLFALVLSAIYGIYVRRTPRSPAA